MTPRKLFTDSDIIAAAFSITREQGYQFVSARSIAKRLGSSTMPIYSSLSSMSNLEEQVKARAFQTLLEFQSRTYAENPLLDSAVGYVVFARDEGNLFRLLFVERPVHVSREESDSLAQMALSQSSNPVLQKIFDTIPDKQQNGFVMKSWIFVHGLATLVNTGILAGMDNSRIISLIEAAGAAFYLFDSRSDTYNPGKEET